MTILSSRTLCSAALLALGAASALAQTAEAPAAPKSDWTITGNAGLFSDYRFRGISQTNKKPAFQGGFDIAHASGFYVGNWNSNIDSDYFSGANLEMDFYGGYKLPIGDFTADFGVLTYVYPGSGQNGYDGGIRAHNTELYIGGSYGPVSLKYSHSVTNFFGFPDSKNSGYLDASFAYDLGGGLGVNAHVGRQSLKGGAKVVEIGDPTIARGSIIDYKLGATYDLAGSGFIVGASLIGTNRDIYGSALGGLKNVSGTTGVLSISKVF